MDDAPLRRTALFELHRALGARIVPFAGFEMPVQYSGIIAEHDAVRARAGLFDLSHMAQFELAGNDVAGWLDELTVNRVATMGFNQARYNVFCSESGGTHDDVIVYRLASSWLVVCNAANARKMWSYLEERRRGDVRLTNRHGERALVALQGPRSAPILQPLVDVALDDLRPYTCIAAVFGGLPLLVARTGYTGEDGFELFVEAESALAVWEALRDAGRTAGLVPCGLGARDMLRLEAGMPLYGHELDEQVTPLQAGLDWVVKLAKSRFIGKQALAQQAAEDRYARIAGLVLADRVPARPGYRVRRDGVDVGEVRSGTIAPSLNGKSIATALVERESAALGTALGIVVRGAEHAATVVALPFYQRGEV